MYWLVDDPYLKTYRASHLLFPTSTALRGLYDNFVGVFTHVKTIEILIRPIYVYYFYGKNAQVVTNLQQTCNNAVPTTCKQDVFALLVPSLLTSF
jgi:hypothetical protein